MKFSALATSAFLTGLALADDIQSKPFQLVLDKSSNSSLNGLAISACHSGAAIEGLCIAGRGKDQYSTFYFNTTEGSTSPMPDYQPSGKLVWNLPIQPNAVSETMQFSYDPSTNVAHPLFEPSYTATYVTFDKNEEMAIFTYVDDSVNPPKAGPWCALKQWYACTSYYTGYTYFTLDWAMGKTKPQNPTCVKTQVKRVFV